MQYKAQRSFGAWWGLLLGTIIFIFVIWGINYSLGPDDRVLKVLLYLPTYVFLVIYLYLIIGAFTMSYRVQEDGLRICWGFQRKLIPWDAFDDIIQVQGEANLFPFLGMSWPGYMIGLYSAKGLGPVRMYATYPEQGFLYLKTQKGFFGLTPAEAKLAEIIAEKAGKEINVIDMDEMPREEKGHSIRNDRFFKLYHRLNIIFLVAFAAYVGIFFPGSGASRLVILLLVLAIALFFFNVANAKRLFQFSQDGGYITLLLGVAVTGIFFILSFSAISL